MILNIDFEWTIDEAGYEWVPGGPAEPGDQESVLSVAVSSLHGQAIRPDRIRRRGGNLRTYRPFEWVDQLYRVFANLGSHCEGLMEFVHRFGPMTEDGNRNGEDACIGLGHAETMAELLQRFSENPRECFSDYAGRGLGGSRIDVALWFNPTTGKPQFIFRPPTLINALWFELGQALTNDAQLRRCAHCGDWFEAGPGTGRRADAKFCSDAHRIAFNSRKRTEGRHQYA